MNRDNAYRNVLSYKHIWQTPSDFFPYKPEWLQGFHSSQLTFSSRFCNCFSDPYSLVYAADTVYCTVPTIITPQHEALLNEAIATLTDLDTSTCMQPFADGRNVFQASADYRPSTTASLNASFSGIGIQCDGFATVYFEETMDGNLASEKRECTLFEQTTLPLTTKTNCVFRCPSSISLNYKSIVTLSIVSLNWAPDSHKSSHLCDMKITQN